MGSRPCFADSRPVIGRAPGQRGSVARLRPCPLGADARAGHRTADRGNDDGRDAVRGSCALQRRALYSLTVRTTLEVGRAVATPGPNSFMTISSYLGSVCSGSLPLHVHDLVAVLLELAQQVGRGAGSHLLEVMHQHDAFAEFLQLCDHRLSDLFGPAHLKSNESRSVENMAMLRSAEIGHEIGRDGAAPGNGRTAPPARRARSARR